MSIKRVESVSENFTQAQRIILGIISAAMLIQGIVLLIFFPEANPALTAVLIRVGTVLGVVWLAFPQLKTIGDRVPGFVVIGFIATLMLMAARPNLFKVAAAVTVVLVGLSLLAKVFRKPL